MDYLYQLIGTPTAASTAHQVKDIHDACGGKVTSFSLDRAQKVIAKYSDPADADSKYYKRIEDLFSTGPYTSSQEAFLRKCCGLDPIDQLVSARLPHPAQSKILKLGPVVRRMARKQIDDSLAGIDSALKNSPILNHFTGRSDSLKTKALRGAQIAYGVSSREYAELAKKVTDFPSASVISRLSFNFPSASENEGLVYEAYPEGVARNKLEDMIGLNGVKMEIIKLSNYVAMESARSKKSKTQENFDLNLNVFFGGNPGTGKTEVARLYGSLLRDAGILPRGHVVSVTRSDLVALYVGHTGPKTRKIIDKSMGGVLFIDEVHSLISGENSNDFAHEAISEIMVAMVAQKGSFAVAFATYESKKRQFFAIDPGLSRRVPNKFFFPDYTDEELTRILKLKASQQGYVIAEDVASWVGTRIGTQRNAPDFGNGGAIESALEEAKKNYASRLMNQVRAGQAIDHGEDSPRELLRQDFNY